MATKTKCPACGAKNDIASHRCRICTAVINPNAAAPPAEEPLTPLGIDHFDAGEINRLIRPVRERLGSDSGALTARLAATRGPSAEPVSVDVQDDIAFDPEPAFTDPIPSAASASTAAPIEYDDEPFDPDALFRDMS